MHSAIECFHKDTLKGREPTFDQAYQMLLADCEALKVDNIRFKDGETEGGLLSKAREVLELYITTPPPAKVAHAELPFEVPIVDFSTGEVLDIPLRGVIDIIEGGDTVVELRTSARAMAEESVKQNLQLTAYSFAYRILYRRFPKLRPDCLLKTKRPRLESLDAERASEDHLSFFSLLREVWKGIGQQVFFPNPGWMCKECEYRVHCTGFGA